ncbi:MAG: BlaI/MecI/CopY family transcriptional regulator [Gemmatimonadaceae bacterium]
MQITLGAREHDVMEALWQRGPSTVADVRTALATTLAHTTVLTILRNLEAKGAVGRWGEGRAHRYFAALARETAREGALQTLLDRFFAGNPRTLLMYLVGAQRISAVELEQLRLDFERDAADRALADRRQDESVTLLTGH